MRFIKIGESYAINVDRILDATYAAKGYDETVEGVGEARAKEIREGLRRLQEVDYVDRPG